MKNSLVSNSTLLFLIFLVLKLTNKIAWSWLWITSPLWIPLGLWLIVLGVALGIVVLFDHNDNR